MSLRKNQAGYTFIELAIIVAILGIVAALVYPYVQTLLEKARESETKANIAALKSAISIYYGDHEGIWPTNLEVKDKTPGWGFGDYLPEMPRITVTHPSDPAQSPAGQIVVYKSLTESPSLLEPGSVGKGWRYDGPAQANTGRVWINSSCRDTQGDSYSTYGYQ